MKYNTEEIFSKVTLTESEMEKDFPGAHYTTTIRLWDDGDYLVRTRHGNTSGRIYDFTYHKSQGESIVPSVDVHRANSIVEDAVGNEWYVPDELIPLVQNLN